MASINTIKLLKIQNINIEGRHISTTATLYINCIKTGNFLRDEGNGEVSLTEIGSYLHKKVEQKIRSFIEAFPEVIDPETGKWTFYECVRMMNIAEMKFRQIGDGKKPVVIYKPCDGKEKYIVLEEADMTDQEIYHYLRKKYSIEEINHKTTVIFRSAECRAANC